MLLTAVFKGTADGVGVGVFEFSARRKPASQKGEADLVFLKNVGKTLL
jgi:hypothetical protein